HPSFGLILTLLRCQPTFTSPATGDRRIWRSRPPAPPPPPPPPAISSTTSSNWITASPRRLGTTAPDSGLTRTILGGSLSGGPPGGVPTLAHASDRARSSPV